MDWVYSVTRIGGLQELHIEFYLGSKQGSCNGKLERMLGVEGMNADWLASRMIADGRGAIEKAAAYLKSEEAACEAICTG